MSGTSCKNKQPSSLWIQGDSLANVHIAPQHRSLTNELVFQLLQHHYSEFNELFGLSSCLYHQEQQENTTSNSNTLSSPIQLKSPSSSHSNSTSSINSSKNQPSSLTSGTTPEDHVNSMMHHHHRRELSRQSSLSQEINFSSPISTTNMKDFDPTTHHMMNNSPSVIVTTKNAEEDRMAMPPPPPKIKQPPSTPTQSSFRNSENYHSLFAMRSGGVELCILSNVTNEMIFIDPRLVKYSTRLQQNDLIVSSALDKSMINTQSTTESPSIIVSPRLRMQHHRWSTYYNHPVHQEDKPLLEQQLSIRKEQSFSSSTSSIDTSSVTPSLVNPASHDEIDAMSQGKPSDTTISAIENSSFLSTGKIYKHHHTISSLNKKEFQQFLPRVSLPNYGDISSVFNLNAEVIQEIGMMDSTLSHHQLVDMLSHNHSGNFSKSSKLSKSFTFGSEKNNSNVSIGTTMTFSSIRVPRQSPRNSTRRSTRNSFSFFGKQYIKGEQYKLKNSSTSIDISSLANEKLGRESVSSEVEAFTNPTSALEGRRYTETDCHPTSSLDIIDLKPVPFSTQRRATTVETTTVNASSSPPIVISKPTSHSTTSVNSSSSIPNSGISPTSPLDIHTSNSTLKTPEKKKTPSTMSSKVKEFFSSIGRRKKKATSSMDMNSNVTNNENSSSPPRHSPQLPPQFKTNHSDTITISPLSSSPISPVKSLPMADIVVHRASCSSTCSNADEHSEANGSQHGNNSTTTTTTSLSSSPPPPPTVSEQQLHKTIQVIETPPPPKNNNNQLQ
ncbi:hypothetical protein C9374_001867 [Naegleria lovaniensis]|uniref:Uncharacterized protein n=1 Tax=Naegleria lovaniensis TaxID=51637 RepID=A0AA88KQW7_NAELO|nr:uncharacterized protein C9374_001867 [Naegleria lovaniensis]KAG2386832.1 hypothetical protein C9374_001867 [Naegleria lovaniensis]